MFNVVIDYNQIIDTPMDLLTVKEDLIGGNYDGPLEFAKDIRLIFQNSRNYNTNKRSRVSLQDHLFFFSYVSASNQFQINHICMNLINVFDLFKNILYLLNFSIRMIVFKINKSNQFNIANFFKFMLSSALIAFYRII